jgi:hypothetical protein
MRFRLFDLKGSLPFSQGYAINELNRQIAGKLEAAGEVDEDPRLPGTLIYIKKSFKEGDVKTSESVWHDDGTSLQCLYHRTNDDLWMEKDNGEWRPCDFTVELPQAA